MPFPTPLEKNIYVYLGGSFYYTVETNTLKINCTQFKKIVLFLTLFELRTFLLGGTL